MLAGSGFGDGWLPPGFQTWAPGPGSAAATGGNADRWKDALLFACSYALALGWGLCAWSDAALAGGVGAGAGGLATKTEGSVTTRSFSDFPRSTSGFDDK